MKHFKQFFILLFLFCSSAETLADTKSISFRHLGVENGLSNNYVTAIVQDKKGCVWIGTESGLNQYDGYSFTVFNSSNSGLKHNAINSLYYDQETNILWIGCKYGGLYALNCATYEIKGVLNDGKITPYNSFLSPRKEGGFWFIPSLGINRLAYYYKGEMHTFEVKGYNHAEEYSSCDDGKGHLFIGYSHKGLTVIDTKKRTLKKYKHYPNDPFSLPGERVYCTFNDHLGNTWIGTNNGLALYNPKKDNFITFRHQAGNAKSLLSDHIFAITEVNGNNLWIGSDVGGISIIDLQDMVTNGISNLEFKNIISGFKAGDLSSANIRNIMQDASGNVWVGNYGNGIDFKSHNRLPFTTMPYYAEGTERNKPVWGVCMDTENNLWAGGKNEIVMFGKDGNKKRTVDLSNYLHRPYAQATSLFCSAPGELLIGIFDDGLLKYDIKSGTVKRLPFQKDFQDVYTFYKDEDGTVWIGSEDGVYIYTKGTLTKADKLNKQLPQPYVFGFIKDRQGKLWIGMAHDGIAVFNNKGRLIKHLNVEKGFPSNGTNQMFIDSKCRIWVATRDGIVVFPDTKRPDKWHLYEPKGSNRYVRAINEDSHGNIWLSSNNVISMLNEQKGDVFKSYDFHDGVPMGNFIEGSSTKDNAGNIYFGSLGGVCKFLPDDLFVQNDVPQVHIIACKRLDSDIQPGQDQATVIPLTQNGLEVDYDNNSFTISFSVADCSLSDRTEYAYMIKGLDDRWIDTNGENEIVLRNLDYGNYELQVKARLKNGQWDENHIARLAIKVNPPLWLSWWAKTLYFLALAGGVIFIARKHERKVKTQARMDAERKRLADEQELNNERLRFYTNVTHELRTPLTLILGPLEDLAAEQQPPHDWQKRINMVYDSAKRLLSTVNQLLEFRKTETRNRQLTVSKGDIGQLVTEIGLRFKELNRNNDLEIKIVVNTAQTEIFFDRDVVTTILDNLLGNALKFTPQGSVKLLLRTVTVDGTDYSEISVNDTGFGIEKDALPHIFERYYQAGGMHQASGTGIGLALVKSMVELHEAEITVESNVGQGTCFRLLLRNDNIYPTAIHKEANSNALTERQTRPIRTEDEQVERDPLMLIVEDNADIQQYVAASFSGKYRILTAVNGKDGWEKARTSIPDIIISDIMMPVMDGIQMCKSIKEDMRTSHIPVILLTAKDSIADKETGYDSGADSYITKPFSARLLKSRVANLLKSRQQMARMIAERTSMLLDESSNSATRYGDSTGNLNEVSREFLDKLNSIIEGNINNTEMDMSFLANELGMSYSSLYRKTKSLTGMTGIEIIRKIRLRHALQLILKGYNVSTAAYDSGFSDLDYFRTWFKKEYGMTPTKFLANNKKQH